VDAHGALVLTPDTQMVDAQGMIRMPASILKAVPGCEHYPDSLFDGKYARVMALGQKDAKGNNISGHIVASDAARVLIFLDHQSASPWANNINQVSIHIAPSITYMYSGHSQVSLVCLGSVCSRLIS